MRLFSIFHMKLINQVKRIWNTSWPHETIVGTAAQFLFWSLTSKDSVEIGNNISGWSGQLDGWRNSWWGDDDEATTNCNCVKHWYHRQIATAQVKENNLAIRAMHKCLNLIVGREETSGIRPYSRSSDPRSIIVRNRAISLRSLCTPAMRSLYALLLSLSLASKNIDRLTKITY